MSTTNNLYSISVQKNSGETTTLAPYKGKVLLIVNTASQCGFTSQYNGLQKLYDQYKDKGFEVLAFPCNQFGAQEPGSAVEIKSFCETRFHIKFPIFSKIDVNGPNAHPLYVFLKKNAKGVLGTEAIKWNFTKFLVDRNGNVLGRYASATTPESMTKDIENALK